MVVSNEDTSLHYEDLDDQSVEDDEITSMDFGVTICYVKIAQYHLLGLKLKQSNIAEAKYRMINKSITIDKIKHKIGDKI